MQHAIRSMLIRTAGFICMLASLLFVQSPDLHAGDRGPLASKGETQCGLNFGYGSSFESNRDIRFASVYPYVGRVLTDPVGSGLWRGTFEGIVEGAFSSVFKNQRTYAAGVNAIARYNFLPHSDCLRPYVQAGLGAALTNLAMDDFGSNFNFVSSAACGLHYYYDAQNAISLEWRVLHMSNAGLDDDNDGLNMNSFFAGFSHCF